MIFPDDPNPGDGNDDPPGGGEGDPPAGGGDGDPPKGGDGPYFPENMPEHLRGESDKETINKLYAQVEGTRKEISERGSVPDKPDGYALEFDDDAKKFLGDVKEDDKVIGAMKSAAHAAGITDKQLQAFAPGLVKGIVEAGIVGETIDGDAELMALGKAEGETDEQRAKEAGSKRIVDAGKFVDGLKAAKTIDEDMHLEMTGLVATAAGVKVIEMVQQLQGERGISTGDGKGGTADQIDENDLKERRNDPRYHTKSPKYDPAFRRETDEMAQKFYGMDPLSSR